MKLTKNKLKQIIKEEFSAVMEEDDATEEDPVELLQHALAQMDRVRELAQKAIDALGGAPKPDSWSHEGEATGPGADDPDSPLE
tara:strand:+ start:396 stop:647 length:252 start_codon:yes stop_codon:yes gene_type:complete